MVASYTLPTSTTTSGTVTWTNVNAVKTKAESQNANSNLFISGTDSFVDHEIKLMKAGVIGGTDKGADAADTGSTPVLGGTADLWGRTWTPSDINDSQFGVVIDIGLKSGGVVTSTTGRLVLAGFNFNIPSTAVIGGIQVKLTNSIDSSGGGTSTYHIDAVEIQITFTWDYNVAGLGCSSGFFSAITTMPNGQAVPKETLDKEFRYRVFDAQNNFLAQWIDVASQPSLQRQINNIMSNMDITLARTELLAAKQTDILFTDETTPTDLTDEDGGDLLVELQSATGLGAGSDAEVNYNIEVAAVQGYYEDLLTESGETLISEDDESFLVANGYPEGKVIYTGFIEEWEANFGQNNEQANIKTLSHADELNNIMMATADTFDLGMLTWDNTYQGIAGGGPDDNLSIGQSWVQDLTQNIGGISMKGRINTAPVEVTMTVITGTPDAPGSTLTTVTQGFTGTTGWQDMYFAFSSPLSLTATTTYSIVLTVNQFKTGGSSTYPLDIQTGASALTTGTGSGYIQTAAGWSAPSYKLVFSVWKAGGTTTFTFTGDPSNFVKQCLDYAISRGAKVRYSPSTIDNTSLSQNIKVETNTVAEALAAAYKVAPYDWYYFYDPADNYYYFKQRPSTVTRFWTLGKDIVSMKVRKTLAELVNEVWFSGSGTPALLDKTVDQTAQQSWRRGLKKLSDNRVADIADADALSTAEITRGKNPQYAIPLEGFNPYFPIEDVQPGELHAIANAGTLLDGIKVQVSKIDYKGDTLGLDLGLQLPSYSERVQQIKSDLENEQMANNATSPS